jgi:hypothetical protein
MKLGMQGMYLNIAKGIYDKPRVIIPFPIKLGMRKWCPVSQLLFNIVLQFLAWAISQEEEIK